MSKLRTVAVAIAAGATALALSACASNPPAAPSSSANANEPTFIADGKLTVCTHLAFKPFQFKDASGAIVGYEVDLMDLVAKDLGRTQEIVDIAFDQITSGAVFAAKKCDVGAAAITIKPERERAATFAQPHFASKQALMVKTGSGITDLPDLKGKTVAVQTDTTGKEYADERKAEYGYETKVFDDMPSASNAVLGTAADATVNDNGVLFDFAKDNPGVEVVKEYDTGEFYGFNVGNDNKALAAKIDQVMAKAKTDGTFNEIYKKWFGTDAPA
ncbi:MAG: ABC transporter substrate-binding protein [Propioniciclava sp.]|uniref:ABC transporter substrate-binding protein n=1 Tax=Propioniciclava sp. TaxID=2038686 RepID=UPI0039E31BF3